VVLTRETNETFLKERLNCEAFGRVRKYADRKVKAAGIKGIVHRGFLDETEPQINRWRRPRQMGSEVRQDHHRGVVAATDSEDATRRCGIECRGRVQSDAKLGKGLGDLHVDLLGPGGRQHRAAGPDKQCVIEHHAQTGERIAHGWLADAEPQGRSGDAAIGHQGLERHHQVQIDPPEIHEADIRYRRDLLVFGSGVLTLQANGKQGGCIVI
jgi:hypothetical protein